MNAKSILRDRLPAIPSRQAFAHVHLAAAVEDARVTVERARAVLHASRGADKAAARKVLKKAHAALTEAERAVSDETRGEQFAPGVQRQTIARGHVVLREARVVAGHGRSIALVSALDRLRNKSSITDAQRDGGLRYAKAYEIAGMDAYPIGLGEGLGGSPSSGNRRVENAVGAGAELRRLRLILGTYGTGLVEHVAVHDLDVSGWAEMHKMDRKNAMGQLQLLLGMLAEAK